MRKNGSLYLFLAALLWSLGGLLTKSSSWNGFCVGAVRGMSGFVLTALLCRRLPKRPTKRSLLRAFCFFAQGLLIVAANKYTTAANATVLQYTSSIHIIVFGAIASRTLPKRRDVVTCAVLLSGVALAFFGSLQGGGTVGNLLSLASGLFYAGVFFLNRQEDADAVDSVLLGNLLYFLMLPLVVTNGAVRASGPTDWLVAGILGVTSALAWLCFARGIRITPALKANFITMLEPVMAPLWTFLLLGERPSFWSLIGCAIVVVTLVIYNNRKAAEA